MKPRARSFHFSQRRNAFAFWAGSAVVSVGVALHLPMFWMSRSSGFDMAGMPMDAGILFGMLLIVLGIAAAGYGLLPVRRPDVHVFGTIVALTLAALAWGFVNFGVLLWLPSVLVAEGRSVGLASTLIARSTLIAAPTIVVSAYLYSVWSTKSSLILAVGITVLGLLAILMRGTGGFPVLTNPVMPLSLLIVGSSAMVSILLPFAAESYPIRVRGRATGWVAGWSLALIGIFGRETRGRDLRELERVRRPAVLPSSARAD